MGEMMNKFVFGDKIVPDGRNSSYKFVLVYNIHFQGQVQLNVVTESSLL